MAFTTVLERRTAMYHVQLAMGAVMADADGWQLPVHYGDASREAAHGCVKQWESPT